MKIYTANTAKYPAKVTPEMVKKSMEVASMVFGVWDWQGMREIESESNLVCLMQEYLDSDALTSDCNFEIYEMRFSDGTSKYYPGYKNQNRN